jgi:hypothetical protein
MEDASMGGRLYLAAVLLTSTAQLSAAQERNMTIQGDGYIETRRGRSPVREARMTLRPDGSFAVNLFTSGSQKVLVTGRWDRQRLGNVERINVDQLGGQRADGGGTLNFEDRDHELPRRLSLNGTTAGGRYQLSIDSRRSDFPGDDPSDRPNTGGNYGSGSTIYRNIDARAEGDGETRMDGIRGGGAFSVARARIGVGRDVIIDIDRPTSGSIRGTVRNVRGNRIDIDVNAVYGYKASGSMNVVLRDANEIGRLEGSGNGERGRWTLEFRGTGRLGGDGWGGGSGGGRDDDDAIVDANERGSGRLTQDRGPELEFYRAEVHLDDDHRAEIRLDSRREPVRIYGRWSRGALGGILVDVDRINDRRSDGRIEIRREGRSFRSLAGEGQTGGGRYRLTFIAGDGRR